MRVTLVSASFGAFLILDAATAWSGSALGIRAVLHNCQTAGIDVDTRIQACSELIHSNLMAPHTLAAFYVIRGDAYVEKKDLDNAMKDFDKAIELKPDYPDALLSRASVLDAMGNHAAAQEDTEHAAKLKDGSPSP